jgi:hypothetical protein
MTDLTTWLLAQIAAEEERAWAATPTCPTSPPTIPPRR